MYVYPTPPYVLLVAGLLIGVLCGFAFEGTLKEQVNLWSQGSSDRPLAEAVRKGPLVLPFAGIMIGICLFLASGIQIFSFPATACWVVATIMTVVTGWLVWDQLGKVLGEIERGEFRLMEMNDMFTRFEPKQPSDEE